MSTPVARWEGSLALLTDLYQVTMAYAYWRAGLAAHEAVFHLFFRSNPFNGGFAIASGLAYVVDFFDQFRFDAEDLAYLRGLTSSDGRPLFDEPFLAALRVLSLEVDLDTVPEGSVVFANEPLLRIRGPLLQCQLLETALLNLINFQTLVATKAARVCLAAAPDPVIEFGLRRAQGMDGGIAASRAAYIGGCAGTSNLLAGKLFGIPVRGTHAHSFVMAFDSEVEAFEAYGRAMPSNCVFLVDTYDTRTGVRHAIEVARRLRGEGVELAGVRIDSGDLATLSLEVRRALDEAGFRDAVVVASNELDEYRIVELKEKGAVIGLWGVGTRLATAYDEPALGGVYKLAAIRAPGDPWRHRVKVSDDPGKSTTPGIQQVRRYAAGGRYVADVIYPAGEAEAEPEEPIDFESSADLLVAIYRRGVRVYETPSAEQSRARTEKELARLPEGVRRLRDPERYPVGLDRRLARLREELARRSK